MDDKLRVKYRKRTKLKQYLPIYILLIPIALWFFVFKIMPLYGLQLAFRDFNPIKGIWESTWVGGRYFEQLFSSYYFTRILINTLWISLLRIVTSIPASIIFALLLNELRSNRFKRVVQTISYLPYFISWVTAAGILMLILSPQYGVINAIISFFGGEKVFFLGTASTFVPTVIVTSIWKNLGWDSILFIATLANISPHLYEAAEIDGASRFQRSIYISLPALVPTIAMVLILSLGSVLSAGFDQIVNLYNPSVYSTGDIIDTYVFREGILNSNFSFATAVGFFKSVIAFILIMLSNYFCKKTINSSLL